MKKYKYSMTYDGPQTWHACGQITKEHAKNQFKAFGVVYKCNGIDLLDYTELSKPEVKKEVKSFTKEKVSA